MNHASNSTGLSSFPEGVILCLFPSGLPFRVLVLSVAFGGMMTAVPSTAAPPYTIKQTPSLRYVEEGNVV